MIHPSHTKGMDRNYTTTLELDGVHRMSGEDAMEWSVLVNDAWAFLGMFSDEKVSLLAR
jgi:hypothetical protein